MNAPVSRNLKISFLILAIVALIFGAVLVAIPGRTLTLLGWVEDQVRLPQSTVTIPGQTFVDGVVTRVLGAMLLALAFMGYLGWRARREQIKLLVQIGFAFAVASFGGLLFGLSQMDRTVPIIGWIMLAIPVLFAVFWGMALRK